MLPQLDPLKISPKEQVDFLKRFATNIEAQDSASGGKAKAITLQILHDKKIFNSE
ncbi:hypothetical protein [Thermoflavimicrobium dichotomicum]|uniref:Uncharacterized protein n=1 Tax=Thermoflavimicrobium dichotomicum TaxID=46223 RepID=A0A1I3SEW7_9BACL|nr:hypothetical protein [Thermoflavimicrobium dichotomicum]SFJ56037.1 hypothetical protein SAMN05421852_112109 [Thermoflavimicrobium dichotomicum]